MVIINKFCNPCCAYKKVSNFSPTLIFLSFNNAENSGRKTPFLSHKLIGKAYGEKKYGVTQIQHMIKNVLYIGKVNYAGQIYVGQQPPIIDEETFKKAQEQLKVKRVERTVFKNTECTGLLNQRLHCPACSTVMFHTYTIKKRRHPSTQSPQNKKAEGSFAQDGSPRQTHVVSEPRKGESNHKYRYYICSSAQKKGHKECPTGSLNAQAIKNAVIGQLKLICAKTDHPDKSAVDAITSPVWDGLFPEEKRKILKSLLERVEYDHAKRKLWITINGIEKPFEIDADLKSNQPKNRWHKEIAIENEAPIVRNLILAHQINRLFEEGRIQDFKQAAVWLNMSPARVSQLMTLNFLSSTIKDAILTLPTVKLAKISDTTLRNVSAEIDWQKQTAPWQPIFLKEKLAEQ